MISELEENKSGTWACIMRRSDFGFHSARIGRIRLFAKLNLKEFTSEFWVSPAENLKSGGEADSRIASLRPRPSDTSGNALDSQKIKQDTFDQIQVTDRDSIPGRGQCRKNPDSSNAQTRLRSLTVARPSTIACE
jgi:hypothetical protein